MFSSSHFGFTLFSCSDCLLIYVENDSSCIIIWKYAFGRPVAAFGAYSLAFA